MLDALILQIDAGSGALLRIYDGTIPTDADTALGAQVLLAELAMTATPSFGAAADAAPNALATANAITADASANATGTASWFLLITQNSGTIVAMGSVGTSASDMIINTVSITVGSQVTCSSFTMTMPEQ